MRSLALLFVIGCGRFGFGDPDAAQLDVKPIDARVEPGLVVWYAMEDDPTDGRIEDTAGGDQPAYCVTGIACGTVAPGKIGNGLHIQMQQFYRLPFVAALDTPQAFSVALWMQFDINQRMVFATKRYAQIYNSWSVYLSIANEVGFESARVGPAGDYDLYGQPLAIGTWFHVAITWDDTTKRIYLNGVRVIEKIHPDIAFDTGEVLLGCDEDSGSLISCMTGVLDEVRIYDRVLTDNEVAVIAQP